MREGGAAEVLRLRSAWKDKDGFHTLAVIEAEYDAFVLPFIGFTFWVTVGFSDFRL